MSADSFQMRAFSSAHLPGLIENGGAAAAPQAKGSPLHAFIECALGHTITGYRWHCQLHRTASEGKLRDRHSHAGLIVGAAE
ncbi:hypothetical protein [Caballeronia grimmiae]|uniref:hypothetical protein n=1 Tax=Caballeronia grimmiae TaxID=1071679 RepID=UPI0038BC5088